MVIGLFPGARYRNQATRLEAGDSLVLFTDGVTEAENELEEQLGLPAVEVLLQTQHRQTAEALLDQIEARVRDFVCGAAANDDVTLLAISRL